MMKKKNFISRGLQSSKYGMLLENFLQVSSRRPQKKLQGVACGPQAVCRVGLLYAHQPKYSKTVTASEF